MFSQISWSPYPLSGVSRVLRVLLSRMIPPPVSLPNMELQRGEPTLLERPEVKHDVWLDPGMLRGEGASEDRCCRIRFRFFTVWNTRFGCSLETFDRNTTLIMTISLVFLNQLTCLFERWYLCSSTSGSSIWSSFLMVPSISAARESWRGTPKTWQGSLELLGRCRPLTGDVYKGSSPSGRDRENGTAVVCSGAAFYFSGSSALPELREASPCTLHTCLLTLAAERQKQKE